MKRGILIRLIVYLVIPLIVLLSFPITRTLVWVGVSYFIEYVETRFESAKYVADDGFCYAPPNIRISIHPHLAFELCNTRKILLIGTYNGDSLGKLEDVQYGNIHLPFIQFPENGPFAPKVKTVIPGYVGEDNKGKHYRIEAIVSRHLCPSTVTCSGPIDHNQTALELIDFEEIK